MRNHLKDVMDIAEQYRWDTIIGPDDNDIESIESTVIEGVSESPDCILTRTIYTRKEPICIFLDVQWTQKYDLIDIMLGICQLSSKHDFKAQEEAMTKLKNLVFQTYPEAKEPTERVKMLPALITHEIGNNYKRVVTIATLCGEDASIFDTALWRKTFMQNISTTIMNFLGCKCVQEQGIPVTEDIRRLLHAKQ